MISRRTMLLGSSAAAVHSSMKLASGVEEKDGEQEVTKADIEAMMKSLSNWGRWGKDDEVGTLNLVTPKKRRAAAALVRDGISISMAHDAVKVSPDGSPTYEHTVTVNNPQGEVGGAGCKIAIQFHGFMHTHIDALCHIFHNGKMYNGISSDTVKETGAERLSINRLKNGIFTKAVLMDLPSLFDARFLPGDTAIYPDHLDAWEKKSGVKVESGDALLIHTGRWIRSEVEGPWEIMKNSAGLHASCLPWIKERDVAIIGSDLALDVMPSRVEGVELPVHLVVVVGMGMCILDVLDFQAVAAEARKRKRWSFLLTVAPLPVEGATGSPINPIAVF